MAIYVRPFVQTITHSEGCSRRACACPRTTDGWEYHIKLVLPNGRPFEERRKSPLGGKAATQRYAEERANHVIKESVAPVPTATKEVPTVEKFKESFLTFSKTNNKPSTAYAKEWMLRVHLSPHFGGMKLDQIGPAEIEDYKAKKLAAGLDRKSINNHLAALRKLLNADSGQADRPFRPMPITRSGKAITRGVTPLGRSTSPASGSWSSPPSSS